jgi:hypothetical protein
MGQAIQIDEARIRHHLGETVRGTVEETLPEPYGVRDAGLSTKPGAGHVTILLFNLARQIQHRIATSVPYLDE